MSVEVGKGSLAQNHGLWSGPASDNVVLTASIGTLIKNSGGSWDWSYTPASPSQSQLVTITANDGESSNNISTVTFQLTVDNTPPTVNRDIPTVSTTTGTQVTETGEFASASGEHVTLNSSVGTVTQDNTHDTWSWGFTPTHGASDSQTVTVTATDADGSCRHGNLQLGGRPDYANPYLGHTRADHLWHRASSAQLDATASVQGTFAYNLASGTVPHAGTDALSVTFTPTNSAAYSTVTGSVYLVVSPAPLTVTADDQTTTYGGSLPTLTASYNGFVNGDAAANLGSGLTLSTVPANSNAGTYAITVSGAVDPDYSIAYFPGTLTIAPARTATTVSESLPSCVCGQEVTFTAAVEPGSGSGNIQFQIDGSNAGFPVAVSGGVATYTATLPSGTHSILAVYGGNGNYTGSTSAAISQTVFAAADWSGGEVGDTNWSDPDNWGGTTITCNDSLQFGSSTGGTTNNDLANGTQFGTQFDGLTFNAGSGAFTLTGNAVNLDGDIVNNSTNTQTIQPSLTLVNGMHTINAASGDVDLNGAISEGFGITTGTGTVTLSAPIPTAAAPRSRGTPSS